ncbi:MAG: type I methionyl aminopeptidase [Gemmatimonas sp.]
MATVEGASSAQLKSPREIEIMARGGAILYNTLQHMRKHVAPGITTGELDALAEAFIRSHKGAEPAFKGLYGFPGSACISVNEEVVHGIPSRKRTLTNGDIVSLDVGVKYEGMYTDAAITVPVGGIDEPTERLLDVTQRALAAGIAAAIPENHVGDIGAAIQAVVEGAGLAIVRELVGHGVGFSPHEELQIPNYGKPKRGKRLARGLTIAIEPMVNMGTAKTRTLSDKWTVVTQDGMRSAHFEHTVAVTDQGPRILTIA